MRLPRYIPPLGPPKLNQRQRVLAQWRGTDMTTLEKLSIRGCKPVGQVMDRLLIDLRIDQRQQETMILKAWNSLIDPNITAHAHPTGIHKGTLFVTVDNSVFHYDIILYHRKEILARMQSSFGHQV